MGKFSRKDFISDLPQSIIDSILTKLPVRDAVRTSVLSSKWRYQWTTMTQLVFDEKVMCLSADKKISENELEDFIMRFLLLHDGPIQKFKLSTSYLKKSTDIDQWLLFLSRKDIKELVLDLYGQEWQKDQRFRTPSCVFSCQKLTTLELSKFEIKPPLEFRGFPCLKYLNINGGTITLEVIENLISSCPLLETFKINNLVDHLALTVGAPNLKHLTVDGIFKDVYLEHTPLLVALTIDFFSKDWDGKVIKKIPVTYDCLKFIIINGINYVQNELLYVLHMLVQSPNLEELQISAAPFWVCDYYKAPDLDFWEKECPVDFTFKRLKVVRMFEILNGDDMEFIKFVLGRSPVLELMSITPSDDCRGKMNMVNEVLRFRQASSKVVIKFFD